MASDTTLKKILRFTKVEHTIFSLPLIFTGAFLGGGGRFPRFSIMVLIVVAAVGARVFGMSMNRVFDRHIDQMNPRTANRELPSGKLSLKMAVFIALAGLGVYLVACGLLNPWCLVLSPIPLIPLLGYSLLKRFTALCHFGIGLCLAISPMGAYVAAAGNPNLPATVFIFAGFVFFWLSGADIIYAILDIDSDRKNHIYSIPAWLGEKGALQVAGGVHLTCWIFLVILVKMMHGGPMAWAALFISAVFLVMMYVPRIPVSQRFFPISNIAGIAGAIAPMVA
ncbi:putative 4-hydroxybenzoate polyprenyltransferase [Desulfosarcina sp. OttesenSCG-928-A07]|nr:putative 4-hydroxybenzoate polyprenyltransferase [Desulfosarcina sp. OttesenSCG-928-G17]MDL2329925.1 putative 4-hydroxybenzoate polyprenyltransferase [Desulfosarcina sp. OttesenSCG-928-A07]